MEGMRRLQEGEQWTALVDYTIIAWGYVQVPIQPGISFMYSIVKGTCTHDFVSSFSNCTGHLYPDSVSLLSLSLFPCFYLFIYLFPVHR